MILIIIFVSKKCFDYFVIRVFYCLTLETRTTKRTNVEDETLNVHF